MDSPDDLSELGDDQNLLELHISEATLYVREGWGPQLGACRGALAGGPHLAM